MPPLETSDLNEKALLWPRVRANRLGQMRVDPDGRTEIPVRWQGTVRDVMRPDGSVLRTDAKFATDREIEVGSVVWRGGLADLPSGTVTGTGTGTFSTTLPADDLMQVVNVNIQYDVRGQAQRYEYDVVRWGRKIPFE